MEPMHMRITTVEIHKVIFFMPIKLKWVFGRIKSMKPIHLNN
jgi:hypothetical protein